MLRFVFWGGLAALLTVNAATARADAGGADVKAIVAKAIEAKGGKANLDKYKAFTFKFKSTINLMGQEVEMDGTVKDQLPDKLNLSATLKVGGMEVPFVQVINGDKGWQGASGMIADMDKDTLEEAREQHYAGQVAELRGLSAKGVKLTALGESKVGDKAVVGLRVSAPGHRDVSLFFDKDSGLVLKSEAKAKDIMNGGTEYKGESLYGDYKKVNGLMMAHKAQELHDGKPYMKMEFTSITPAEKLDDKDFAKP